jgi:hypothetical protein
MRWTGFVPYIMKLKNAYESLVRKHVRRDHSGDISVHGMTALK